MHKAGTLSPSHTPAPSHVSKSVIKERPCPSYSQVAILSSVKFGANSNPILGCHFLFLPLCDAADPHLPGIALLHSLSGPRTEHSQGWKEQNEHAYLQTLSSQLLSERQVSQYLPCCLQQLPENMPCHTNPPYPLNVAQWGFLEPQQPLLYITNPWI